MECSTWPLTRMADDPAADRPRAKTAGRAEMRDAVVRELVAEGVRAALQDGARAASDPVAFLRQAAAEVELVVGILSTARPSEGAELRAIIAEEVAATAKALIGRRNN
jgi:hypothetical protein